MRPSHLKELLKRMLSTGRCSVVLAGYPGVGKASIALAAIREAGFRPVAGAPKEGEVHIDRLSSSLGYCRLSYERAILLWDTRPYDEESLRAGISPLHDFVLLTLDPNLDDWKAWALSHGIRPEVVSFLSYRPERLLSVLESKLEERPEEFPISMKFEWYKIVTPRSWELASDLLDLGEFRREALVGLLGGAIGYEFHSFLEEFDAFESEILRGKEPLLKDEKDKYALMGVLLKHPGLVGRFGHLLGDDMLERLKADIGLIGSKKRERAALPASYRLDVLGLINRLLSMDREGLLSSLDMLFTILGSSLSDDLIEEIREMFESTMGVD